MHYALVDVRTMLDSLGQLSEVRNVKEGSVENVMLITAVDWNVLGNLWIDETYLLNVCRSCLRLGWSLMIIS